MNSPNVNSFHYGDISTDEDEEDNIEIEDVLLLSDNINSYHYGINDSTSENFIYQPEGKDVCSFHDDTMDINTNDSNDDISLNNMKRRSSEKGKSLIQNNERKLEIQANTNSSIYELDLVDYLFLDKKLNPFLESLNLEKIDCVSLERCLEYLERCDFIERTLLDLQNISNLSITSDLECSICCVKDDDDFNQIIVCEICGTAVHQDCYGISPLPSRKWFCEKCENNPIASRKCVFCPYKGGAMKQTTCGRWAHVICTMWLGEVYFKDPDIMKNISGVDRCLRDRRTLLCFICKKKYGACTQCSSPSCALAYHATCAAFAGLYIKVDETGDDIKRISYCVKHTNRNIDSDNRISEDLTELYKKVEFQYEEWEKKYSEIVKDFSIKRTPRIRHHHIKTLSIIYGKEVVNSIIEYWAAKRAYNHDTSLLKYRSCIPMPKGFSKNSTKFEQMETLKKLEKDKEILEGIQKLLLDIQAREDAKSLIADNWIYELEEFCKTKFITIRQCFDEVMKYDDKNLLYKCFKEKNFQFRTNFEQIENTVYENGYNSIEQMWEDFNACLELVKNTCEEGTYLYIYIEKIHMEGERVTERCKNKQHDSKFVERNLRTNQKRLKQFISTMKNVVVDEDLKNKLENDDKIKCCKSTVTPSTSLSFLNYRNYQNNTFLGSEKVNNILDYGENLPAPVSSIFTCPFEHEEIVLDKVNNVMCQVIDLRYRYCMNDVQNICQIAEEVKPQNMVISGYVFVKTFTHIPEYRWVQRENLKRSFDIISGEENASDSLKESMALARECFVRESSKIS
ncbi:Zinc finger, PHD-type domain and Zinc finger, FYVE/PHD-type domain and Zinc finger, RING/FYVE/PHD-type domain and Zinc finger, PHD-finger domain-containing protein [Strongyloides ratti]|uniref:Zinc finger, PHD-type domain and Zinc finger, FYVE/PHD-type domain and Zinc finger, RING/FYVE/PHD-type domain and Zinc finger, PHD-finger domain-containing protein n=1 Tax=Strongyloides ratti TaxID=34506 RepID=A0A090MZ03_STRRB|nr:Zinc finger, PHD-type domain and Zinc finger, FYVE/PHD-type domain and Zinc finger, RING/FYVE/PHD-type domain and Zinc finger, PHD-finger domain-containing protein [Strongyloides ratti]CEF68084.1 Zinc finger, PHD-type domain and Zinc finger, FYVE/PHD-type domain and Zinc finger, RING/FYVE/PHD-type domain and Zinc finger, PHD-finger domain-containing protein [Strongyloides ratti]